MLLGVLPALRRVVVIPAHRLVLRRGLRRALASLRVAALVAVF